MSWVFIREAPAFAWNRKSWRFAVSGGIPCCRSPPSFRFAPTTQIEGRETAGKTETATKRGTSGTRTPLSTRTQRAILSAWPGRIFLMRRSQSRKPQTRIATGQKSTIIITLNPSASNASARGADRKQARVRFLSFNTGQPSQA